LSAKTAAWPETVRPRQICERGDDAVLRLAPFCIEADAKP